MKFYQRNVARLLAIPILFLASKVNAELVVFEVDSAQSAIGISVAASSPFLGTPSAQGAGAWLTHYTGTLIAEVTDTTFQLLPGTTLVAGISGNWRPGNDYSDYVPSQPGIYTEAEIPANYATTSVLFDGRILNTATRDLSFGLVDDVAKPLTGGAFSEVGTTTSYLGGIEYYSQGASPPISSLTGPGVTITPTLDALGTGLLNSNGTNFSLTLPVQFIGTYGGFEVTYAGTVFARSVPEPGAAALLSSAVLFTAFCRKRRNR